MVAIASSILIFAIPGSFVCLLFVTKSQQNPKVLLAHHEMLREELPLRERESSEGNIIPQVNQLHTYSSCPSIFFFL
jgi:hypothetical protein